LNQNEPSTKNLVPSLEYYITIISDLTKLVRILVKSQKLSNEKLSKIIRDSDLEGNLSSICFELFKRFVVYDSGSVK